MATKLLEIELSEGINDIPYHKGYKLYRILVRMHHQPLGWISLSAANGETITEKKIYHAIQHQFSWKIMQTTFAENNGIGTQSQSISQPISVVICTRNRTENLTNCLQSLAGMQYDNYEIIVVDNAPSNEDTYHLAKQMNVRYVREDTPGLDWARNRGIKEASYDIVAFTDDDVIVDRYWLHSINNAFANPEVMAATGYVAPAKLNTKAEHVFELAYGGMGHGFHKRFIRRENLPDRNLIWASNFGIGANMSFRKKIFDNIGMFDVALDVGTPSNGGGDIEMFHRVVMHGHTLVYDPSIFVWHNHRENFEGLKKQIFNNGRSFGCYLINCVYKSDVKKKAVLRFLLIDWLFRWNLTNLFKSSKIPRSLSLMELYGMFTSPFAYKKTKAHAKKMMALQG